MRRGSQAIERYGDLGDPRDFCQTPQLRFANYGERDEKILGRRAQHDFGLANFCDCEASSTQRDLLACEKNGLVRFRVGAQPQAMLRGIVGNPLEIALHNVEVDNERRSIEILNLHYYLKLSRMWL